MRQCPTCSEPFADALRFCPTDGAALSACGQPLIGNPLINDPLIGELLHGQFRLLELVGAGGCGDVYRAHQIGVERVVAVKVLHPEAARSAEFCGRFLQEARAAAHLNHPNIITVFNVGHTQAGLPFMAMEWIEGDSLGKGAGAIECRDHAQLVGLAKQIVSALVVAHGAGVIHRDLKPDNILVARHHGQSIVKMLDFGIAKVVGNGPIAVDPHLTRQGVVYGTPQYLSPEQAAGHVVDERSDLYSLGIILYELLSGGLPFRSQGVALLVDHLHTEAPDIREQVPGISEALAAIVMSLLAKDPTDRPASAAILLSQLQALESAGPNDEAAGAAPLDVASSQRWPTAAYQARAPGRTRSALALALFCVLFMVGSGRQVVAGKTVSTAAASTATLADVVDLDQVLEGPQRALMVAAEGYALRVLMPEELHAEREQRMAVEIWAPDGSPLDAETLVLVFVAADGSERGVSVPQSKTPGRYLFHQRFAEKGHYAMRILPQRTDVDLIVEFEVAAADSDPNS